MRAIIILLLLSFSIGKGYSQRVVKEIRHFLFPEFTNGTVLMKSGVRNDTLLNYNSLTEEMLFVRNGKTLAIINLDKIDTVFIENRIFIPMQKKFAEVVYHNNFDLYALNKASVIDPGKPSAYGGTSHTSAITPLSSFVSGGQTYDLKVPEGSETREYVEYYLKQDGQTNIFLSIRQLSKLYKGKKSQLYKFVRENRVTYEDQESLVELIRFMEKIN
jgi:hypothetical protein